MLTALSLHATTLFTLICWRQWLSKNLVISWKGLNCLWLFDHWWAETFCPLRLNNTYKIPKNAWYESLNELTFQEVKLSCIPTDHLILFYDCFNKTVSGQDEVHSEFWLATRADKMNLTISHCPRKRPLFLAIYPNESIDIDLPCRESLLFYSLLFFTFYFFQCFLCLLAYGQYAFCQCLVKSLSLTVLLLAFINMRKAKVWEDNYP